MHQLFHKISIKTKGQDLYNFTPQIVNWVDDEKLNNGILNINK